MSHGVQTSAQPGEIVLTDPRPHPRDERCPRCEAKPEKRIDAGGFGRLKITVCSVCGYEFQRGE